MLNSGLYKYIQGNQNKQQHRSIDLGNLILIPMQPCAPI